MIRARNALTIGRQRRFRADMTGDGRVLATLEPNEPSREYVFLVLGDVRRGETVSPAEVMAAVRRLVELAS